jgi:DnaJ-domain-containing protein 1
MTLGIVSILVIAGLVLILINRHRKDVNERKITELKQVYKFYVPSSTNAKEVSLRIHLLLSAWLMKKNSIYSIEKEEYIINYLNKIFNIQPIEIRLELELYKQQSVHVRSVANWITSSMKSKESRSQLMQFLVQLSFSSGNDIIDREFTSLIRLGELIGIQAKFIDDQVVQRRKELLGEGELGTNFSRFSDRGVRRKLALAVLNLLGDATEKQIKKRYRELVKEYHPDTLIAMDEHEQHSRYNRFLAIQDAYEELMEG